MDKEKNIKKIVFVIGSMGMGGAERVISILANYYADKGWKVDILTLLDDRNEYELNKNIIVNPIFNKGKSRIKQLPYWITNIRKYIIKKKPNIIVSFVARINIITILSCIGLNKKIVISERNDPARDERSIIVKLATRLLYPLCDCIVFQTRWAQSCFPNRIKKKSVIIPNPINVSNIATRLKQKKIVAVGRLVEQKNHTMLIRAFKKIYVNYPDYKLFIYGEGKLRSELMKLIKELKLTQAVFLPGNVSNIHERIADAEMFVLSSNYEGLSNSLLEAMMMGLPCISTNCAGSNEVIRDGINGFLIPVGDIDKLAEVMEQLIINKEMALRIGKEAKMTLRAFHKEKVIKKWELVLESNIIERSKVKWL